MMMNRDHPIVLDFGPLLAGFMRACVDPADDFWTFSFGRGKYLVKQQVYDVFGTITIPNWHKRECSSLRNLGYLHHHTAKRKNLP